MTPVVLQPRKNRYSQIEEMKRTPGYVRRKVAMKVMESTAGTKSVSAEQIDEPTTRKAEMPQSVDLFGNSTSN